MCVIVCVCDTYIRQINVTIPLHCPLHLVQTSVVPAGELEPESPVRGDNWPANQLQEHVSQKSVTIEHSKSDLT